MNATIEEMICESVENGGIVTIANQQFCFENEQWNIVLTPTITAAVTMTEKTFYELLNNMSAEEVQLNKKNYRKIARRCTN